MLTMCTCLMFGLCKLFTIALHHVDDSHHNHWRILMYRNSILSCFLRVRIIKPKVITFDANEWKKFNFSRWNALFSISITNVNEKWPLSYRLFAWIGKYIEHLLLNYGRFELRLQNEEKFNHFYFLRAVMIKKSNSENMCRKTWTGWGISLHTNWIRSILLFFTCSLALSLRFIVCHANSMTISFQII